MGVKSDLVIGLSTPPEESAMGFIDRVLGRLRRRPSPSRVDLDLIDAATTENLGEVLTLLDRGANVNARDKDGRTALHRAADYGRREVLQALLDRGADIEAAVEGKYEYAGGTALLLASEEGDLDVVRVLLDRGANVNARDNGGRTALQLVFTSSRSSRGRPAEVAKLLLDRGANVNGNDKDGYTPLMNACHFADPGLVTVLLDKGAKVNVKSKDGETALMRVASGANLKLMRALLDRGADVNAKDKDHETALHHVFSSGTSPGRAFDAVQLLLEKGAKVNVKSKDGETVLIKAAWYGYREVVETLLGKEAKVSIRDKWGKTAVSQASKAGHSDIVKVLLDRGAKPDTKKEAGRVKLKPPKVPWHTYGYLDSHDRAVVERALAGEIEPDSLAEILFKIYTLSYLIRFDQNDKTLTCKSEECQEGSLFMSRDNAKCLRCSRAFHRDQFDKEGRNKLSVAIGVALANKGGIKAMELVAAAFPNRGKVYLVSHSWDRVGGWLA